MAKDIGIEESLKKDSGFKKLEEASATASIA